MKKILLGLVVLSIIFLGSCSDTADLSEAETKAVLEVLSSVSTDAFDPSLGRGSRAESTASFSVNSTLGGTAVFTFTSIAVPSVEGVDGASGGFNASFDNYKVTHVNDAGGETNYTLNGTVYFQCAYSTEESLDAGYTYGFNYEFLMYTDADDTLSIEGGTIDTALQLNVRNTVRWQMGAVTSGFQVKVDYESTGDLNGAVLTNETGSMVYTFSSTT